MQVYVKVKVAGKRKPVLDSVPYEIPDSVLTLRDFLTSLVHTEVERYNQKGTDVQLIPFLTAEETEAQAQTGKVGFGRIYSEKKADEEKAVQNAIQCLKDGLVRVFHNDTEVTEPEEALSVREGDTFVLIRLTFLTGRLW